MPSVNKIYRGQFVLIKLLVLISTQSSTWKLATGQVPICPNVCSCSSSDSTDLSDSNIVAVCRGTIKDLQLLNFPKNIHKLDLSDTSLQTIPSYYFIDRGLAEVFEMDLSRNNLSHIYSDMFVGLNKLQFLDLSFNQILHIDAGSLSYNEMLSHLNLRGTRILLNVNEPIVVSLSLEYLDVSYCGLRELPVLAFSNLPYLKVLNLSWNPLSGIDVRVFDNLKHLHELDITKTYIRCDSTLAPLAAWGAERAVKIDGYPCLNSHQDSPKFVNHRRRTSTTQSTTNDHEWETPYVGSESSKTTKSTDATEPYSDDSFEDFDDFTEETTSINDLFHISSFLPQMNGTLLIACIGGFGLGIAVAICITAVIYCFCCKSSEDEPNEVISAGEDFQLVDRPRIHGPVIRDPPPSYSSLFSSRYQKVLPTAPRWPQ